MITQSRVLDLAADAESAGQAGIWAFLIEMAGRFDRVLGGDHFDVERAQEEAFARGLKASLDHPRVCPFVGRATRSSGQVRTGA